MRGAAAQAATASGVNQTVRLPRARRAVSYSAQLVTRCFCLGMWRRQAALALNGTADIQASGKGPSSYTAQLPTPTGRFMQQGAGKRKPRNARAVLMDGILGRVMAGVPLLPGHAAPLNATEPAEPVSLAENAQQIEPGLT